MKFDLEQYLNDGIAQLVKDALRISVKNPKQSAFFLRFTAASKKAAKRRQKYKKDGKHIPPFLIASITEDCNLQCTGCYSQANHRRSESGDLSSKEWERIFNEASELGISFILLAGGEPMLRRDVIEIAANQKDILFPMFTNGTMINDAAMHLFDTHRNLIPVISIEGGEDATDARRGEGIYKHAMEAMHSLNECGLLFGSSITVTSANLDIVTSDDFLDHLERYGCKLVLYVDYVPFEHPGLALDENGRVKLKSRIDKLRFERPEMLFISFPGDEAESGGCLAAGRGFFHISASGNAEPCPFSPYSDVNLYNTPLAEALDSPLFYRLHNEGILAAPHTGGCVLFEQEETVRKIISESPVL